MYLFDVVKKLSMVVTPSMTRAGSAFHSIQKVTKEDVTRISPEVLVTPWSKGGQEVPGTNTVV